ncbi:hypothetical protein KKP97_02885 [Methanothermococcus sp. SCGC AD-155-C09]|nr:hypothetical protein [Methanothermococcus sp. SCGC AD-155-C09]
MIIMIIIVLTIILMPLQIQGGNPKVVKAWLGVYKYNNTYYDPLGNTFDGESSYSGPDYRYAVINYQLDNGVIIRQVIKLNDNKGTTSPAPTVVLSWTAPNGTTYSIFRQRERHTYNITPLPYITEIPVGSQIKLRMNDNYNDDNYVDGHWDINISENGINFNNTYQNSFYHHNLSFVFQNLNTNSTWELQMPYKEIGSVYYSGIIPFNGSNAIIYNISGDTPYKNQVLQYTPPANFFEAPGGGIFLKILILVGALIIFAGIILFIINKKN